MAWFLKLRTINIHASIKGTIQGLTGKWLHATQLWLACCLGTYTKWGCGFSSNLSMSSLRACLVGWGANPGKKGPEEKGRGTFILWEKDEENFSHLLRLGFYTPGFGRDPGGIAVHQTPPTIILLDEELQLAQGITGLGVHDHINGPYCHDEQNGDNGISKIILALSEPTKGCLVEPPFKAFLWTSLYSHISFCY